MRAQLYSVQNDGQRYSAAEGNVKAVLSMLALPGLRESIVLTKRSVIKTLSKFCRPNRPLATGKETTLGGKIYILQLENEWNIEFISYGEMADKEKEDEYNIQIKKVYKKNFEIYQINEESKYKRTLYLDIKE